MSNYEFIDKLGVDVYARRIGEHCGRFICDFVFILLVRTVANREADWTNDLRSNAMFHNPVELNRWILITTERTRKEALEFTKVMIDAAAGLRFVIKPPKE